MCIRDRPDIFPRLCQEPRWASQVSIQCNFLVLEWLKNNRIALIVVFKWFEFYRFLNVRKFHFFLFTGLWESNPRPHCSSSHVLPSTPLWGSRQNVTQQKLLELLPSKLVFPTHQTVEPPEPTTIPTSSRLNTQMATFTSCNPQLYRTFYSRCIHFPASSSTTNSPHTRVNYVARCLLL